MEVLTMAEIEALYPREWALIVDPQKDEFEEVIAGTVAFHSPDRDEIDRKLVELRPSHFALYYLGPIAEGLELIL
jgi:hypothetical protein